MKKLKSFYRQHIAIVTLLFFIVLSIAMVAIVYLQPGKILSGSDYHFHMNRIENLAISLKQGELFPKISYFFIGGMGYAAGLFYPDFFLYLPAILRVVGFSIKESFVVFAIVINLSTFLVTYGAGKLAGFNQKRALVFALVYGLSIYRFADLVNRQAIGEVIALTFFPLIIVMMVRFKAGIQRHWYLLSVGLAAIGYSHMISVEMTGIFILVYTLFNLKRFYQNRSLKYLIAAGVMTIGLLGSYFLAVGEQMTAMTFQVATQPLAFLSDRTLALDKLLHHSLTNAVFHANTVNVGITILIGLVIAGYSFWHSKEERDLIVIAFGLFIMATPIMPWHFFDDTIINTIQFPWRFFVVITAIVSYLIAKDDLRLLDNKLLFYGLLLVLGLGNVIYATNSIQTQSWRFRTNAAYNQPNSYYIGAGREYLPAQTDYSKILKNKKRTLKYRKNDIKITKEQATWGQYYFQFATRNDRRAVVEVPFIYYKGYVARISGENKLVPLKMNQQTGLTQVTLKGSGTVTILYQQTPLQKVGNIISVVSLVSLMVIIYKAQSKPRFRSKKSTDIG
ncbi:hypothetical protein ACPBEH_08305 [Latilactobacillus sp. 5-91]|uniref:hypothetical protein n=1 Tax=Latilactobacillus sp. 5-91 TaxID=3410924 RepID=UPI003C74AD09